VEHTASSHRREKKSEEFRAAEMKDNPALGKELKTNRRAKNGSKKGDELRGDRYFRGRLVKETTRSGPRYVHSGTDRKKKKMVRGREDHTETHQDQGGRTGLLNRKKGVSIRGMALS